ncbi:MAG: hypothetical protein KJ593_08175 [Candidatus Omnitrophica bacterium]|nr:hypothetical protein [Candidatus Omnitrophota bacterium]
MLYKESVIPKAISFISTFYSIIAILYLLTLPMTIWTIINKHDLQYRITAFISGVLPLGILSIATLVSARGLLRIKEWARKLLLILSVTYIFYGLLSIITISATLGFNSPIAFNIVLMVASMYSFYYLNKAEVKDWIKRQANRAIK